ncbi:MAG: hypothetical protein ABIP39_07045, partial [Polyangiaceae bacterium]
MLPERQELPPPPIFAPPPLPNDEPAPPVPAPRGEVLRWFGAIDAAATGSLGGSANAIGGELAARWDFAPKLSLRLAGGLRSGSVTAADADSLIFDAAAGLVWRAVRATTTSGFGVSVRADALAIQYRLSRETSHATLWLPGADLALEGSFLFAERMALFAAVGGEVAFGATDVFLHSEQVATISPFRGLADAGLRVHF